MSRQFDIHLTDPPWPYNNRRLTRCDGGKSTFGIGASGRYHCLSLGELAEIRMEDLGKANSVMAMWVTVPFLHEGMHLLEQWGYRNLHSVMVWVKVYKKSLSPVFGPGHYFRCNSELVLLGMKGKVEIQNNSLSQFISKKDCREFVAVTGEEDSFFEIRKGEAIDADYLYSPSFPSITIISPLKKHSEKPKIHDLLTALFGDLPDKVETFAREEYPGWVTTGFDSDGKDIRDFIKECKDE